MTDPDRAHTQEPAEGSVSPGQEDDGAEGRTPHPQQPAEGDRDAAPGSGAETPGA